MRSYLNINVMSSCVLCLVVLLISPLKHEKKQSRHGSIQIPPGVF